MTRILKIDQYTNDFPSIYGLDADGSCYEIIGGLLLDALLSYKEIESIEHGKYFEPIWTRILTIKGDLILSSKNGAFIKFMDHVGFVPCKPGQETKPGEPPMLGFPPDFIKKIGKDLMNDKPMSFEERNEVIKEREII